MTFSGSMLRPLDGLEKAFWLLDQNLPTHFSVVAEVTGPTEAGQWVAAFDDVGKQSAFAACQILSDRVGTPFFQMGPLRGIPTVVIEGEADRWTEHVERELAERFDPTADVLIRARVLHDADRTTVIATFHHSIADGSSAVHLLRDVIAAAGGVKSVRLDETMSIETAVEGLPSSPPEASGQETAPSRPPFFRNAGEARPSVSVGHLSTSATTALRDRARKEHSTVHGALCAAAFKIFSDAGASIQPPQVFSPVDARRRLLAGVENLGAYVSGVRANPIEGSASFWTTARHFSQQAAALNAPEHLTHAIGGVRSAMSGIADVPGATALWSAVFGAEILLTNLSTIETSANFGPLSIEHLWGPAVSIGIESEQSIGVVTTRGEMHLVHTSFQPIDGYLDALIKTLQGSVGGTQLIEAALAE